MWQGNRSRTHQIGGESEMYKEERDVLEEEIKRDVLEEEMGGERRK